MNTTKQFKFKGFKEVKLIPEKSPRHSKYYSVLVSFLETGMAIAKLKYSGVPSQIVVSSLKNICIRYNFPIRVYSRDGEIYLENRDVVINTYKGIINKMGDENAD